MSFLKFISLWFRKKHKINHQTKSCQNCEESKFYWDPTLVLPLLCNKHWIGSQYERYWCQVTNMHSVYSACQGAISNANAMIGQPCITAVKDDTGVSQIKGSGRVLCARLMERSTENANQCNEAKGPKKGLEDYMHVFLVTLCPQLPCEQCDNSTLWKDNLTTRRKAACWQSSRDRKDWHSPCQRTSTICPSLGYPAPSWPTLHPINSSTLSALQLKPSSSSPLLLFFLLFAVVRVKAI